MARKQHQKQKPKKKEQQVEAPTHHLHDPIADFWRKYRNYIYWGGIGIVGLLLILRVVGYFQERGKISTTSEIIALSGALPAEEIESRYDSLSSSAVKEQAAAIAFQKFVEAAESSVGTDSIEKLDKARTWGKKLQEQYASSLASARISKGPVALGLEGSGISPLESVSTLADSEPFRKLLSPPPPPTNPVKVKIQTTAGDLEISLYRDQAPELCDAFLAAAEAAAFDELFVYKHVNANINGAFQFGDARIKKDIPEEVLPQESFWGKGPNLAPVTYSETGLSARRGWVAAVADPRSGKVSAREIAVFTEDPEGFAASNPNPALVVFGKLDDASLEIAEKVLEGLDLPLQVEEEATEEEDAGGEDDEDKEGTGDDSGEEPEENTEGTEEQEPEAGDDENETDETESDEDVKLRPRVLSSTVTR